MSKSRVHVCAATALAPGEIIAASNGEHRFAVYNVDGVYCATDDVCTHGQSSLSEEGRLDGDVVVCGWHGGRFCVSNGQAVGFPAMVSLRAYAVRQEGDELYVEVDEP